jgi:predicted ATPase/class 3 adenylate cyclase
MTFDELLAQVVELLQRQGRVSYGALKRRFALDDDYLQDLKDELIDAQRVAVDEDGKVLMWVGGTAVISDQLSVVSPQLLAPSTQHLDPRLTSAERRQLTVMFCDLVGSTALSTQLDPEELREVIRAYRETCATIIRRFDGYLAKYLGDGLLVYFGYPLAHEDDAQRAVRAGLEIVAAFQPSSSAGHEVPSPLAGEGQGEGANVTASAVPTPYPNLPPQGKEQSLQVRIGIHTGLVVAGEMGVGDQPEPLAIVGETPNLAARLQQEAQPDTVVISAATYHLIQGYFECADLGLRAVRGVSAPLQIYRVLDESEAHGRLEIAARRGLTPLVGREQEVRLLLACWKQVKEGQGQVVLLSGEAGIGKSRLVRVLRERIAGETQAWLECRCSPYHQNSALYSVVDLLQRVLGFTRDDSPGEKLRKLEVGAAHASPLQADLIPLLAALLSLPHPDGYPPLNLTPQRQKQKTLEALLTWLLAETERQPLPFIVEDLHWADPSTLEFLGLLIEQVPTARLLTILASRPEFTPPWASRSYLTHLTLQRLPHKQVQEMVEKLASDQALPVEVLQQVVAKTDGVPLFVEELTKTVLESQLDVGAQRPAPLPLGIPATLQDALMARLDRLENAKEIAQLGATLGREFSYEVLHMVSPLAEAALQQRLRQLVEAELLYQRGLPPQVIYFFKHALIQDAAYQSLLKSTRQQYHRQIAEVLEERFPETVKTQPELLAHHYTEAGLMPEAITYWRRAGRRASDRSAYAEAISHLAKGLELLKALPDTSERTQQELRLQIGLGWALMTTKGYAAPEAEKAFSRALELCRQAGETPLLFPVMVGLTGFYMVRGELQTARELAEKSLRLAQSVQDRRFLQVDHYLLGETLLHFGELASAQAHLEQSLALYAPQQSRFFTAPSANDPGVSCLSIASLTLWVRGYPDQAFNRSQEALALAQELAHPFILAYALSCTALLHLFRREAQAAQEQAEALLALSNEHGFALRVAQGTTVRGWALAEQGQVEEGIAQIRQGRASERATGVEYGWAGDLVRLAWAYGEVGQAEEGLNVLAEALAAMDSTGGRFYEAELYRLKGTLTLQSKTSPGQVSGKSQASQDQSEDTDPRPLVPDSQAEACFWKAIEIARRQQAKSWELRAVVSLSRLWQQQGKKKEAHEMLVEIYDWFTEGFDTKDLQEAKALLEELIG